jgi:hypothetical protein
MVFFIVVAFVNGHGISGLLVVEISLRIEPPLNPSGLLGLKGGLLPNDLVQEL